MFTIAKYINADEFSKKVQRISGARLDCLDYSARSIITLLDMAETADVQEVKHGYWIEQAPGYRVADYECSVCHSESNKTFDYCPDCGATMDLL